MDEEAAVEELLAPVPDCSSAQELACPDPEGPNEVGWTVKRESDSTVVSSLIMRDFKHDVRIINNQKDRSAIAQI